MTVSGILHSQAMWTQLTSSRDSGELKRLQTQSRTLVTSHNCHLWLEGRHYHLLQKFSSSFLFGSFFRFLCCFYHCFWYDAFKSPKVESSLLWNVRSNWALWSSATLYRSVFHGFVRQCRTFHLDWRGHKHQTTSLKNELIMREKRRRRNN